jgi:serine/threonine protein kinase
VSALEPGAVLDGFVIGPCIYSGGMAEIFQVTYAHGAADPGFPMVMKVPRMAANDSAGNIVSFEVEHQVMQIVSGPHVPRFVAAGDLERTPYLVMEYVQGRTLQHWVEQTELLAIDELARVGVELAKAVHSLHELNIVHLDLKPANVLIRPDGRMVLLDFGLSYCAHYPDLLAGQMHRAVGSPASIAPEQVVGVRGDARSDIFAIGVILYQLLTGHLPFGEPLTEGGLRQRMWMDPVPPRKYRPLLPPWLQEIVLRCLEPNADQRYSSAAHLAFDLSHPEQVKLTERGRNTSGTGWMTHLRRWLRAAGMHYQPSPLPLAQIDKVPIVMVAVPNKDASDVTLYALRRAVARSLGIRPGARLACVTVISPGDTSTLNQETSQTSVQQRLLTRLQKWAQPLDLPNQQTSCYVLESGDVAQTLIDFAQTNQVSVLLMGAATHGLKLQRIVATVPIKVAMAAPCTVILVRPRLPFGPLGESLAPQIDKNLS